MANPIVRTSAYSFSSAAPASAPPGRGGGGRGGARAVGRPGGGVSAAPPVGRAARGPDPGVQASEARGASLPVGLAPVAAGKEHRLASGRLLPELRPLLRPAVAAQEVEVPLAVDRPRVAELRVR